MVHDNAMNGIVDYSTVWRGIEPSFFYDHWDEKLVVALVSGSLEKPWPPPFEVRPKSSPNVIQFTQILAPMQERPGGLPRLPEEIRSLTSTGSALLLFPTGPDEVPTVASNWAGVLDGERWWGGTKGEGHLFFVSFEVGDDPNAYAKFLRPERALWRALHDFHPSRSTEYHLKVVEEALELGELVMERFFGGGRKSYHTALQALCDTAGRIMVLEKLEGMKAVRRESDGTPGPPQEPPATGV